jgi:ribosomal protein S18 acetylase RimI-like enzyme
LTADIQLRDLERRDLRRIAEIHARAFPDSALTLLGRGAVERYYRWQMLGPHKAVCLGAESAGSLVGYCIGGLFAGALSGFLRKNRPYLVASVLLRPWLAVNPAIRARVAGRIRIALNRGRLSGAASTVSTMPPSFGILAIAVDPLSRRGGVGRLLMSAAESAAVAKGFSRMSLTVHPSNAAAVAFYESLGWVRVPDSPAWSGYMAKSLDAAGSLVR